MVSLIIAAVVADRGHSRVEAESQAAKQEVLRVTTRAATSLNYGLFAPPERLNELTFRLRSPQERKCDEETNRNCHNRGFHSKRTARQIGWPGDACLKQTWGTRP